MRLISLIVAATFAAVPAGAIDLTGTWEGSFSCSEVDSGVKFKFTLKGEVLFITQVGSALNVQNLGFADIAGVAIDDASKPNEKGAVAMIDCDTATDPTTGYGELANLRAKVNRAKGKGSLKGTSVYTSSGDTVGQCKWNFKLTDTADPGVAATCP